jgi:hypothetical protein
VGCDSKGNLSDRMTDQSCDRVARIVGDRSFSLLFVLRKKWGKELTLASKLYCSFCGSYSRRMWIDQGTHWPRNLGRLRTLLSFSMCWVFIWNNLFGSSLE